MIPDFTHLTLADIAGYLFPLAAVVFLAGVIRAAASATILWTYLKDWIVSWLAPVFVLLGLAAAGQGVPELHVQPNLAVQLIFIPAAGAYFLAALAAIAKSAGVDLARLPLASNVRNEFVDSAVKAGPPPA